MKAFNKIACFTDIHFGEHRDDEEHNKLCIEFLEWFKSNIEKEGCDAACFLGDWHHSRNKVGVNTLFYSKMGLDILNSLNIPVYFILGNHDIFFQDSRRVHSLPFTDYLDNITLVDKPTKVDDTLFVPWIVTEDDRQTIASEDVKYVFGHFEFPGFMMNAMVEAPDREDSLPAEAFDNPDFVFSGHFHKRQRRVIGGVTFFYIGNAFPHNFADEGDTERGMMILERGEEPRFIDWPDMPTYHRVKLSEVSEHEMSKRSVVKIIPDLDITKEDRAILLEGLAEDNPETSFSMDPIRKDPEQEIDIEELTGQTVESIIIDYLTNNDHDGYDGKKLVDIYLEH